MVSCELFDGDGAQALLESPKRKGKRKEEKRADLRGGGTTAGRLLLPDVEPAPAVPEPTFDNEAVRQLLAGPENAEECVGTLMERNHWKFLGVAAPFLCNDYHESEDAVQDAWVSVVRTIGNFRRSCAFTTWFYKIVQRAAMTRARKRRGGTVLIADDMSNEVVEDPAAVLHWQEILERLPDEQHTILNMRMEKYTYDEIALAVGIPVGTVRSRLSRMRQALRQLM